MGRQTGVANHPRAGDWSAFIATGCRHLRGDAPRSLIIQPQYRDPSIDVGIAVLADDMASEAL